MITGLLQAHGAPENAEAAFAPDILSGVLKWFESRAHHFDTFFNSTREKEMSNV